MVCGPDLQAVLEQMSLQAAQQAAGLVPFHAAALSTSSGVIAIAGPSGTGKSTLDRDQCATSSAFRHA